MRLSRGMDGKLGITYLARAIAIHLCCQGSAMGYSKVTRPSAASGVHPWLFLSLAGPKLGRHHKRCLGCDLDLLHELLFATSYINLKECNLSYTETSHYLKCTRISFGAR